MGQNKTISEKNNQMFQKPDVRKPTGVLTL